MDALEGLEAVTRRYPAGLIPEGILGMDTMNRYVLVEFHPTVFVFGDKGHNHRPALVQGIHGSAPFSGPLGAGTYRFHRIGREAPERWKALIVNNGKATVMADTEIHRDHCIHPPGALPHIPESFFHDEEVSQIFQDRTGLRLSGYDGSPDFTVNMAGILAVFIPGPVGQFRQSVMTGVPQGKPDFTGGRYLLGHTAIPPIVILGGKNRKRQAENRPYTEKTLANIHRCK
jgi:hypothetical protein